MTNNTRLLTNPTSVLGKRNLTNIIRDDSAWILLPLGTRTYLYSLLPAPLPDEPPHDPDIHPCTTKYKIRIEEAVRQFQEDLKEGRETKSWRTEAMQAGKDRREGKFDEWKEANKEEIWGKGKENIQNARVGDETRSEENGDEEKKIGDSEGEN